MKQTSRRALLKSGAVLAAGVVLSSAAGQDTLKPIDPPPGTQPAPSTPAPSGAARRPEQAEVLRGLLQRQDRPSPTPIPPTDPIVPLADRGLAPDGQPLLLEGSFIVERAARIDRSDEQTAFLLSLDGDGATRRFKAAPNQMLEAIEREAERGADEFIISAEITRYRGENYLVLRKALRRTPHGNLGPS